MAEAGLPLALRERLAGELDAISLRAPEPQMARYRLEPAAKHHGPSLGPMVAAAAALAAAALFAVSPEHAPQKLAIQVVSHLERTHVTNQAPARQPTGRPASRDGRQVDDQGAFGDAQMERLGTAAGPAGPAAGQTDLDHGQAGTGAAGAGGGSGPSQGESAPKMSQERSEESEQQRGSPSDPPKRSPQPREGSDRDPGRAGGNGD